MFKGAVGVRPRPAPLRRGHRGAASHGPGSQPRGSEASASRAERQPVPAREGRGRRRAGARGVPGLGGRAQGFALRLSEAGSRGRVLRHGGVTASCVPAALRGDRAEAAAGAGSRGLTAAGPWWRPLRKWLDFGKCVIAIWNAAKSPAARCLRVTAGGGGFRPRTGRRAARWCQFGPVAVRRHFGKCCSRCFCEAIFNFFLDKINISSISFEWNP